MFTKEKKNIAYIPRLINKSLRQRIFTVHSSDGVNIKDSSFSNINGKISINEMDGFNLNSF